MWHLIVERWESLTKEQRISMVVLGLCGILAVGLSVYNIKNSIRSPFMADKSIIEKDKLLIGETDAEKIARQKRVDTDGDGLSDWDESNVYKTNPNLRDSCGDGISDNVRVRTGKYLGCLNSPSGVGVLDYSQVQSTSTDLFSAPSASSLIDQTQAMIGADTSTQSALNSAQAAIPQRDPASIRQMLLESGQVNMDEVNKLTDQELLNIYDQAVQADTQGLSPNGADQAPVTNNNSNSFLGTPPTATTTK